MRPFRFVAAAFALCALSCGGAVSTRASSDDGGHARDAGAAGKDDGSSAPDDAESAIEASASETASPVDASDDATSAIGQDAGATAGSLDATVVPPPAADSGGSMGASDAASLGADASLADLMVPCAGGGDVFYVDALDPTIADPPPGAHAYTPSNARWSAQDSAMTVSVSVTSSDVVGFVGLSLTGYPGFPLAPGTYAEPSSHAVPRPTLDLTVSDVDLTADGSVSGSFAIAVLETTDAGGGTLSALSVSFDITVPFPTQAGRFVGCVNYRAGTVAPDAGDSGTP